MKLVLFFFFYAWACQSDSILPNEKHEQDPRMFVTILIPNVDNVTIQRVDPHYQDWAHLLRYFCVIGPPCPQSPNSSVITSWYILWMAVRSKLSRAFFCFCTYSKPPRFVTLSCFRWGGVSKSNWLTATPNAKSAIMKTRLW